MDKEELLIAFCNPNHSLRPCFFKFLSQQLGEWRPPPFLENLEKSRFLSYTIIVDTVSPEPLIVEMRGSVC